MKEKWTWNIELTVSERNLTLERGSGIMRRSFNTTGVCNPEFHYMVDIQSRLSEIKKMVDKGEYFTINRARQYGKTTILSELKKYLSEEYIVVSIDFQLISHANFKNEFTFVKAFSDELLFIREMPVEIEKQLEEFTLEKDREHNLRKLFRCLSNWCAISKKPIVLMIDEVDSATNNQVFLDFLAQLRGYYIHRTERPTFQSVILAGVYDVKNMKRKIRSEEEHNKTNSPWNIATDFKVSMSFTPEDIAGMLGEYEMDYHTGMNINEMAELIYDYTSGYPFLVSRICKLIDEEIGLKYNTRDKVWTKDGLYEAVRILLSEKNTLFESLMGKLYSYPQLERVIYSILFGGEIVVYNPFDEAMDIAMMFGFIKKQDNNIIISNRIFETLLYNYFLTSVDAQSTPIFRAAANAKSQYIKNGHLDMDTVMNKFVEHFDSIYGDQVEEFDEEEGRRRFLLYLRPIINGVGNYYIEAMTRNSRRMDVVVDYLGERFVIELKIWRGNSYNERGEKQLSDYLDYFHLKKGYMLSYNFNQKKEIGVKNLYLNGKILVEAVV